MVSRMTPDDRLQMAIEAIWSMMGEAIVARTADPAEIRAFFESTTHRERVAPYLSSFMIAAKAWAQAPKIEARADRLASAVDELVYQTDDSFSFWIESGKRVREMPPRDRIQVYRDGVQMSDEDIAKLLLAKPPTQH